jgi:hypothetical protein
MRRLFLLSAISTSAGSTAGSEPGCRKLVAPAGATAVHEGVDAVGATTLGTATVGTATVGTATVAVATARAALGDGTAGVATDDAMGGREVGGELFAATVRGVPPVDDAEVPDITPTTAAAAAAVVTAATNARRRLDMLPICPD